MATVATVRETRRLCDVQEDPGPDEEVPEEEKTRELLPVCSESQSELHEGRGMANTQRPARTHISPLGGRVQNCERSVRRGGEERGRRVLYGDLPGRRGGGNGGKRGEWRRRARDERGGRESKKRGKRAGGKRESE